MGTDGFHLTIYVSPAGRFYAGVDSWAFEYSGNGDAANCAEMRACNSLFANRGRQLPGDHRVVHLR